MNNHMSIALLSQQFSPLVRYSPSFINTDRQNLESLEGEIPWCPEVYALFYFPSTCGQLLLHFCVLGELKYTTGAAYKVGELFSCWVRAR